MNRARPQLIALGNDLAGDDAAGLIVARALAAQFPDLEVILAGRPGAGLLDLWDPGRPVLLLDAVDAGRPAGTVLSLPLAELLEASETSAPLSSHGLGPAEALRLGAALGRPLPEGQFIGVQGARFTPATELSAEVDGAIESMREQAEAWVRSHL